MKKTTLLAVGTLLACFGAAALAGPAPWYKWRSKSRGTQVCSQTPLGAGWEKASGPFTDSQCTKEQLNPS